MPGIAQANIKSYTPFEKQKAYTSIFYSFSLTYKFTQDFY
jgi:hypothetical protein